MITAATLAITAILLVAVTLTGRRLYPPDPSGGDGLLVDLLRSLIFGALSWVIAGSILCGILALAFGIVNLFFPAVPPVKL